MGLCPPEGSGPAIEKPKTRRREAKGITRAVVVGIVFPRRSNFKNGLKKPLGRL